MVGKQNETNLIVKIHTDHYASGDYFMENPKSECRVSWINGKTIELMHNAPWRSVSFQQRFSIKLQFTSSGLRSPSQGKKQNLHRRRVIIPCKRYLIIRKVNQITLNEVKEANFMWTCARVCELVAAFSATCICYVFPAMPTRTQKGQRVTVPQVHGRWYTCTGSASFRTFTYIFASGLERYLFTEFYRQI